MPIVSAELLANLESHLASDYRPVSERISYELSLAEHLSIVYWSTGGSPWISEQTRGRPIARIVPYKGRQALGVRVFDCSFTAARDAERCPAIRSGRGAGPSRPYRPAL